jgi:hypothetical protein
MKKLTLLSVLLIFTIHVFGQNKDEKPTLSRSFSITSFYHKNIIYTDTISYDIEYMEMPKSTDSTSINRMRSRVSFASAFAAKHINNKYTFDSIPEIASVNINGIHFENKKILSKTPDYDILMIKKDSSYSLRLDPKTKQYTGVARYAKPYSLIYQNHINLPRDFFFFKQYTLEPIRYTCTSYSPVLDIFLTEDSIVAYTKPRVMLDGRLQAKAFDYQHLNLENIKHIDIFAKEDAGKYFGFKAKNGLISIVTKNSDFDINRALANTHVIGEMQDKNGNWRVIKDTLLTSQEQFKEFRKKVYQANGPVFLINGEFETESVNRKTIDADAMESVKVVSGKKLRQLPQFRNANSTSQFTEIIDVANDTIYIQTEKERWTAKSSISIPTVMSQLKRLRNTDPEPTPIYFVDNQEITAEKLKEFKNKELEFVQSLEGCDAISKYGKRGEYGVVIYRKKKIE